MALHLAVQSRSTPFCSKTTQACVNLWEDLRDRILGLASRAVGIVTLHLQKESSLLLATTFGSIDHP
jgi:hypothetical protein